MQHKALFITFIIFGALVGSVMGEIFGTFFPIGFINTLLSKGLFIGFDPVTANLGVIILTLGFNFKFNLLSATGVVLGIYAFRKL